MNSVVARVALVATVAALAVAPSALARDYAGFARNVIPSGQYGAVPPPPKADDQALMYDGLTPLFGSVRDSDLIKYFKPEVFGTRGQGPTRTERVPRAGVRIVRDRWNVPHITGRTRADVAWGAGWVTIEDRYLLIGLARNATALAALDVPGLDPFGVALSGQRFEPSRQTKAFLARQTGLLRRQGPKGRQLLRDIDAYIAGGNAYYRATTAPTSPSPATTYTRSTPSPDSCSGAAAATRRPARCSSTAWRSGSAAGAASASGPTCARGSTPRRR